MRQAPGGEAFPGACLVQTRCAPVGIRTPNLLIRRSRLGVRPCPPTSPVKPWDNWSAFSQPQLIRRWPGCVAPRLAPNGPTLSKSANACSLPSASLKPVWPRPCGRRVHPGERSRIVDKLSGARYPPCGPGKPICLTLPTLARVEEHHDEWDLPFRRRSRLNGRVQCRSLSIEGQSSGEESSQLESGFSRLTSR